MKLLVAVFAFFDLLIAGALFALLFVSQNPESALLRSLSPGSLTCLALVLALSGLLGVFWLAVGARQVGVEQRRPGEPARSPTLDKSRPSMTDATQAQLAAQLSEPARAEALTFLAKQRKIEAIKVVRQDTGLGLKESKELVEWMEAEHGRQ